MSRSSVNCCEGYTSGLYANVLLTLSHDMFAARPQGDKRKLDMLMNTNEIVCTNASTLKDEHVLDVCIALIIFKINSLRVCQPATSTFKASGEKSSFAESAGNCSGNTGFVISHRASSNILSEVPMSFLSK